MVKLHSWTTSIDVNCLLSARVPFPEAQEELFTVDLGKHCQQSLGKVGGCVSACVLLGGHPIAIEGQRR